MTSRYGSRIAPVPSLAAAVLALLAAAPLAAQQRDIWVANANGDSLTRYESTVGGERPISAGRADQGDWLVHAACWRADPKPFDRPPVD